MHCVLCNEKSIETRVINDVIYHQCNNCLLIFKDQTNLINQQDELTRYQQHNNEITDVGYQNYFIKTIEDNIKPLLNFKDLKILDFGSGPNPVLQYVFKNSYNQAISIYDKYFANDDLVLTYKYDLITCTEVIEHIYQLKDVLNQFDQILDSNGHLFIMTNFTSTNFQTNFEIDKFSNWFYIRDITHVVFFSLKTFEYIANEYNYQIINTNNKNTILLKKGV